MTAFEDLIGQWASRANVADWQRQAKKHKHRCVYVLECKGVFKIGKTGDLNKRMKSLQVANPFDMKIAHVIFTEDHHKVEQALHLIFAESRERDEWFNLGIRDLAAIKSMTVQQILRTAEGLKAKPEAQPIIPADQMTFKW
jgi:hypothetical protein